MIKGFTISPVMLGRIAIGEVVERNGKKTPNKLDHIVITGMSQIDGVWAEHPVMIEQKQAQGLDQEKGKLRTIPVRLMFDSPGNNFKAEYSAFDSKSGRPLCAGNGETAKRRGPNGVEEVDCVGSENCQYGRENRCKQFGRLMVGMESSFQKDPLAGFMFRTTSFNSIRAISARLEYLGAVTGDKLSGLPCNLRIRNKSTAGSFRKPIFYLDLEPAEDLFSAVKVASEYHQQCASAGVNLAALDDAVARGFAQSTFFEDQGDGSEVVEEFYSEVVDPETGEIHRKQSSAAPQASADLATEEQVAKITELLAASGRTKDRLNEWLGKPAEQELSLLTKDDAERAIIQMSPKI